MTNDTADSASYSPGYSWVRVDLHNSSPMLSGFKVSRPRSASRLEVNKRVACLFCGLPDVWTQPQEIHGNPKKQLVAFLTSVSTRVIARVVWGGRL